VSKNGSMEVLAALVEDGLNGRLRIEGLGRRFTVRVDVTTRDGRTSIELDATASTLESASRMVLEGLAAANIRPGGRYADGRWLNAEEKP
jgi:hypothetical protein